MELEKIEPTIDAISETPEKKKRYIWKFLLAFFLLLIGYYIANSFDVPEESIQNENLIVPPNIIPDEGNAFFEFQRLSKEINAELNIRKTSTGKDFGEVVSDVTVSAKRTELLDFFKNTKFSEIKEVYIGMEKYYPQLDALMQMKQYQSPYYADMESLSFEELVNPSINFEGSSYGDFVGESFSLIRLQKLRAVYLFFENKPEAATNILSDSFQFFQVLLLGNTGLLEYLGFGITMPQILLEDMEILFHSKKLSHTKLVSIRNSIKYFEDTRLDIEEAFKFEYMMMDFSISMLLYQKKDFSVLEYSPYHLKKKKTRRYIADWFQYVLDPTFEPRDVFIKNIIEGENRPISNFLILNLLKENAIGKILTQSIIGTFDSYEIKRKRAETYFRLFSVQVGLQGYFERNKQLPETLQALVPEFMDSLPSDPFGEEFEYLPQEKLLRSQGFTEEGGPIIYKIRTWE